MSSDLSEDSGGIVRSRTVCALCRQRKTRCDRNLPKCGFCIKAKVDCRYLPKAKKRGLRAGYVAELESRIASLEGQMEKLKDVVATSHSSAAQRTSLLDHALRSTPATFNDTFTTENAGTYHVRRLTERLNPVSTTNAAITDLTSLPRAFFRTLADRWFSENQHWIPILDRDYIEISLDALPDPVDHITDVVLRALVALRITHSSQAIFLGYEGRRRLSLYLRSQVVMEAMSSPSLQSVQALLIIALLDYSSDEIPSTLGIMAVARRMGENLGIFRKLLSRIQTQSPTQALLAADVSPVGDSASIALTWAIVSFDTVTGLGVSWQDASSALSDHLSGIAYLHVPDFRDSFRTHTHLAAIGLYPVHEFITAYARGEHQILSGETARLAEDLYRNMMSYYEGLPASGYTTLADGDIDFDINHVLTRFLSHATVIAIYERYTLDDDGDFELARDRCNCSCDVMIDIVRNLSDADIEFSTPPFAHFLGVAARVKIVLTKKLSQSYDPLLDVLMHGINMCARSRPIARRLEYTLAVAITECNSHAPSTLPEEFWDLKRSSLDISESMKRWLHDRLPSIQARHLALPYV